VVITGGSSGIGLVIARQWIERGGRVHLIARNAQRLTEVCAQLGERAFGYEADLSSGESCAEAIGRIRQRCPRGIDGLVLNAARYGVGAVLELDRNELQRFFATNVYSLVDLVRGLYPALLEGQAKSIVMVSTTLSTRPVPGTGAYSSSKAAMNTLARVMALEFASDGIRVNTVLPGVVDTPIHDPHHPDDPTREEKLNQLGPLHPLGRVGQPVDVASMVLYLLSDRAGWMTGSEVRIDGGIGIG